MTAFETFREFAKKQDGRETHEWSKWDGSEAHANEINDVHCARLDKERERLGIPTAPETDGYRQVCEEHLTLPRPNCITYRLVNNSETAAPWKCQICGNTAHWLMLILKQ